MFDSQSGPNGSESDSDQWNLPADAPILDLTSDEPLPELGPPADANSDFENFDFHAPQRIGVERSASGELWLNGDVLMCPCPDCQAPMTIRLWLMVADCWSCDASIELTEQQEREARALLERSKKSAVAAAAAPAAPTRSTPPTPAAEPAAAPPPPPERAAPNRRRRRRRVQPAPPAGGTAWARRFFRDTPAWLISLIFHLVLLTLLGILHMANKSEDRFITLTTAISRDVREGGDTFEMDPDDEFVFDLPIPVINRPSPRTREAMIRADQDARELRINPDSKNPNLPKLDVVKSQIKKTGELRRALVARDPRVRVEMVTKEGGTTLTEAAVARGLRWLAMHQAEDGHWSLHRIGNGRGCRCGGGGLRCDSAGTSLALFPFLGAGQTHLVGKYKDTVAKGLRWLVENQEANGDLRAGSTGNAGMYAHGQATIVLCEAYLMTGDEQIRKAAEKGVDFIVAAQHDGGGWRYSPKQAGDTSVLGWQLMALQSGRAAGLAVPEETFGLANNFLDTVERQGGRYAYQPRQGPTAPMTAEAILCRMYLGWKRTDPGIREGINWLLDEQMPAKRSPNIYYWYYGTQAMHHYGGRAWDRWNLKMRDILVESQRKDGHAAGSWDPRGPHASAGGRIYMTSLAVCSLEVYYRHLPIFRQIDID